MDVGNHLMEDTTMIIRSITPNLQGYNYRCNYCNKEWKEVLPEEQKLAPTKVLQPIECDIFVAPHAGLAKCDIELIEE